MVKKFLARNVILIRALVCPSYMPGQYSSLVVSGVYQDKKSTSNVIPPLFQEHLVLNLSPLLLAHPQPLPSPPQTLPVVLSDVMMCFALVCHESQQCYQLGNCNMRNIVLLCVQYNIHVCLWITAGNRKKKKKKKKKCVVGPPLILLF